jgi:HEAT repeat protein
LLRNNQGMNPEDINELFLRTLSGNYEDDAPWDAVAALRRMGTREVFDQAAAWCQSDVPLKRARGADVLAQLRKAPDCKVNAFSEESYALLTELVQEESHPRPLASAIAALGHLDNPSAVPIIANFHAHPNAEVRYDVAFALGCFPDEPRSVQALVRLMRDADEDVSEEALVGLAKRKDRRIVPMLLAELEKQEVGVRVIEAAYLMLDMQREHEGWNAPDYAGALRDRFPHEIT